MTMTAKHTSAYNTLVNKLANDYTRAIVKNPNGVIFDHIQAMIEDNSYLVRGINTYHRNQKTIRELQDTITVLVAACKMALIRISGECYSDHPEVKQLEIAIATAEGRS